MMMEPAMTLAQNSGEVRQLSMAQCLPANLPDKLPDKLLPVALAASSAKAMGRLGVAFGIAIARTVRTLAQKLVDQVIRAERDEHGIHQNVATQRNKHISGRERRRHRILRTQQSVDDPRLTPTSAVYQPVRMATKPVGNEETCPTETNASSPGARRMQRIFPAAEMPNMSSPIPTMTRNPKNGMTTGGRSSRGNDSSPTSGAVQLPDAIMLPSFGTVMANRLNFSPFESGIAISVSDAGCSFFHRTSIAANFAGWCCSTYSPVRWPKKSWTGDDHRDERQAPMQHQRARRGECCAAHYQAPVEATHMPVVRERGKQHMRPAHHHHQSGDDRPPVRRNDLAVDNRVTDGHLHPAIVGENPERRKHRPQRNHSAGKEIKAW